jgi:hypothetical protein
MYDSEIAGQTDFFYGFGTCWVTKSAVTLRGCGGGITAWKGTNTTVENKYGVYIHDSTVKKANASLEITNQCYLGRPWNAQHRSIFAYSYLDDSVNPSGYVQWNPNDPRVNQSKQLPARVGKVLIPPLTVFPTSRYQHGRIQRLWSRFQHHRTSSRNERHHRVDQEAVCSVCVP